MSHEIRPAGQEPKDLERAWSESPRLTAQVPDSRYNLAGGNQTVVVNVDGRRDADFQFDGGAGSYLLVGIGAFLVTLLTFGLATPWALCMQYRWRTQHTTIGGHRLRFTGTGWGLFGYWIKWWALSLITLGIYLFWVQPRLVKWTVEHQEFS